MIPCLWLTAGHVMGDPFEISTLRREVSRSCLEPSLQSMNQVYFHQLGLFNWILCGMYAQKSVSPVSIVPGSVVVSLANPTRAPRGFHLPLPPLPYFWNKGETHNWKANPFFFFYGSSSLLTSKSESSTWSDQLSPL